jgi:D-amino-acid dehydrogenase
MAAGVRLTTGIEFAASDAPPNDIQLQRCEALARSIYPLGERIDPQPWLGLRPCLPDMRPVIGPAGRHPGLWFNFGHAHHGLTLGPVSGRLLAQMMTGQPTLADPQPYAPGRFNQASR